MVEGSLWAEGGAMPHRRNIKWAGQPAGPLS